ncbi:MAG: hypothetical protein ACI9LO_003255, partial [Planctomycetota bacterium]
MKNKFSAIFKMSAAGDGTSYQVDKQEQLIWLVFIYIAKLPGYKK